VPVVEPEANPETVAALVDATWRMVTAESARTDALDRKAATVATFASLVVTLTATLGLRFVERYEAWWAVLLFVAGLVALLAAVSVAVVVLFPREHLSLGMAYLKRFPTSGEIRKPPEQVQGATMRGLVRERDLNQRKARLVRWAFVLLLVGLVLIASEAATLALRTVTG
jgi:hypothetical protein